MKCTRPLVIVALIAASWQLASADTGMRPYPTHGAYWLIELSPVSNMTANWPCQVSTSDLCRTPSRIDYRVKNTFNGVPAFEGALGYTFNRYVAIEAGGGFLWAGGNYRDDTYMNDSVQFDAASVVNVTLRGDLPITRHISLYGKYGLGYQSARMTYDEKGYGSEYVTGNPTTEFHQSFNGSFRTMSVGLSFLFGEGLNYRLGYTHHTSIGTFSYDAIKVGVDLAIPSTWH